MIECKIVCEKDGESHMYTVFNHPSYCRDYYFMEENPVDLEGIEKRCGRIVSIEKSFGKCPWVDTGYLLKDKMEGEE